MWKHFYAECESSFGQLDDQSDGHFGQFGRPGQFFSGILEFVIVSTFEKLNILGSVMVYRENINFDPGVGRFVWCNIRVKTNRGRHFSGCHGSKCQNIGNIRKFKKLLLCG